jgi:uncharacterized repeat protein (TIGR03803 family)
MQTRDSVCIGSWFTGLAFSLALLLIAASPAQAQTETVLYSFAGVDGSTPEANLILISSNLYGTTANGGAYGDGTVFKLTSTDSETVLHSFAGSDGGNSGSGLILRKGGLYGTTFYGGTYGYGNVFKINLKTGKETVLYNFPGGTSDGANPQNQGELVMDAAGNLYGTTTGGGVSGCDINGFFGCGTVFKLTSTGSETVLYRFCSETSCADGQNPIAGLVVDSTGTLYGTTFYGGAYGYGTVFKLNPTTGQETVLYSFTGGNDGEGPVGGVLMDRAGNLFGTTLHGGGSTFSGCDANGYVGCGTVFELTTTGQETVLYSFTGGNDGAGPCAGLIKDAKGNFYSTTYGGGTYGAGAVFKLTSTGSETVLHSFAGGPSDGANPHGSLVRDTAGNIYGTTMYGGGSGYGTVFKLTPPAATTTTLTSSLNPSTYGQAVTFSAVVTSKLGAPPDGETVTFKKGTTVLGTGSLSNGSASLTISTLKVGTNSIKAVYGGDSNFNGSTSILVEQVVTKTVE